MFLVLLYKHYLVITYLQICFSCQRVSRDSQSVLLAFLLPGRPRPIFTPAPQLFFRSQVFNRFFWFWVIRISNQKIIKTQDAPLFPRGKGNRIPDKSKPRRNGGEKGWQRLWCIRIIYYCFWHHFVINAGPEENGEEGQIAKAARGVWDSNSAPSGEKWEAAGDRG